MTESAEAGRLSVDLGADLTARLRMYAKADRRSVDAVVADEVEEYLGTPPNHEQARAAGLDDQGGPQRGGPLDGSGV
ncbi:hypothetical protein [Streptomyces sp. NPDC058614]|uniref:hypothetical protein n=1 Tax=Streptomyces sp. NPDC058614 TaxID=3346557 RepID=UPI00364DBC3B